MRPVNMRISGTAPFFLDPFGNTLASSGPLAEVNLYRFSSKELHGQSGFIYYLYRYYAPSLQRWPNRDPLQEAGAINLYSYCGNASVNMFDPLGLQTAPQPIAGLGIRPIDPAAITPFGQDACTDSSHVFAFFACGNKTSTVSFGPSGGRQGTISFGIHGPQMIYTWPISYQQYSNGLNYISNLQSNTPNYSPQTNCATVAVNCLRVGAGLTNVPTGVGQVYCYNTNVSATVPNPLTLMNSLTGGVRVPSFPTR